jgi:hypothetical protein
MCKAVSSSLALKKKKKKGKEKEKEKRKAKKSPPWTSSSFPKCSPTYRCLIHLQSLTSIPRTVLRASVNRQWSLVFLSRAIGSHRRI